MENASLPAEERSNNGPLVPLRAHPSTYPSPTQIYTVDGLSLLLQIEEERKHEQTKRDKKGERQAKGDARKSNRLTVLNGFES